MKIKQTDVACTVAAVTPTTETMMCGAGGRRGGGHFQFFSLLRGRCLAQENTDILVALRLARLSLATYS